MSGEKFIELEGVHVRLGGKTVLEDVSFYAEKGEMIAVIGGSGAGKTTCLRVLTGQLRPVKGEVRVAGINVVKEKEKLKHVLGYVPQLDEFGLYYEFSALENACLFARMYGVPEREAKRRAMEILEVLGFKDRELMEKPVGKLSGGERKRVSICVGLIHEPQVLLLDEPTTGLDAHLRVDVLNYLRNINKQYNVTMGIVSHDLEIADFCNRVVILDKGRVVLFGDPKKFVEGLRTGYAFEVSFKKLTEKDVLKIKSLKIVVNVLRTGRKTLKIFVRRVEEPVNLLFSELEKAGLTPTSITSSDITFTDYFRIVAMERRGEEYFPTELLEST